MICKVGWPGKVVPGRHVKESVLYIVVKGGFWVCNKAIGLLYFLVDRPEDLVLLVLEFCFLLREELLERPLLDPLLPLEVALPLPPALPPVPLPLPAPGRGLLELLPLLVSLVLDLDLDLGLLATVLVLVLGDFFLFLEAPPWAGPLPLPFDWLDLLLDLVFFLLDCWLRALVTFFPVSLASFLVTALSWSWTICLTRSLIWDCSAAGSLSISMAASAVAALVKVSLWSFLRASVLLFWATWLWYCSRVVTKMCRTSCSSLANCWMVPVGTA